MAEEWRKVWRRAVLVALAAPDADLVAAEVDVLHTQAAAFEQAQAAAVEQGRHPARLAFHASEHGAHLVAREHDRKARGALGVDEVIEPGQLDAEHPPVEEEQRRECLGSSRAGSRDRATRFDRVLAHEGRRRRARPTCRRKSTARPDTLARAPSIWRTWNGAGRWPRVPVVGSESSLVTQLVAVSGITGCTPHGPALSSSRGGEPFARDGKMVPRRGSTGRIHPAAQAMP